MKILGGKVFTCTHFKYIVCMCMCVLHEYVMKYCGFACLICPSSFAPLLLQKSIKVFAFYFRTNTLLLYIMYFFTNSVRSDSWKLYRQEPSMRLSSTAPFSCWMFNIMCKHNEPWIIRLLFIPQFVCSGFRKKSQFLKFICDKELQFFLK